MAQQNVCYWCSAPAITRDHVPPKNLFPKHLRKNLITVPACGVHNNHFAKLDERMRFFLQAGSDSPQALAEFSATTMRSLERVGVSGYLNALFGRAQRVKHTNGENTLLQFPATDTRSYLEKITRGIHFIHKQETFDGECTGAFRQSFVRKLDAANEFFEKLAPHFRNNAIARDGITPYPEIFRYKVIEREERGCQIFAVAMHFYQSVEAISLLTPKNLEEAYNSF